ncbi:HopJ type III effector protein [Marinomonas sp. M1K-6]|uniref:HopJ type III effector protein n=1 Tax=Marinomonas profundi TaxID=2726122 RepID=A0A847R5S2_9GAMM|nr:HopJ type III effector protein [Marinomonas profundi]NLQ17863.1 HopJ type III effector protein [Marinomonas profundi]UDV03480.1 HopJ type III effector protein [Marinomonas profundi]
MLSTQTLIEKIKATPKQVQFKEVIEVIEREYDFTPMAFTNGKQSNGINENNGSCKILSFASIHQLNAVETLNLFGDFYRVDVLENPTSDDHQNIRQFIENGWSGITFTTPALAPKAE